MASPARYHPPMTDAPDAPDAADVVDAADAAEVLDPADPRFREVRLAELIMPNHTNHHGNLFGGHALGLMDHAGWVAATRCARRNMVTVASDRVEFKVPVRAGQLVELAARVTRVGRTSVTVAVDMWAEDVLSGERRLATSGNFVFVAIDEDGHPTPVASE
jgi:uncharacterized protein (TIGR00369 family)